MVIRVLYYLLWSLHIAEECDVAGNKCSGCNRTTDVQKFMETFLDMNMKSASWMKLITKTFRLGTTVQKCQIIRISELSDARLKEFCCIQSKFSLKSLMQNYAK